MGQNVLFPHSKGSCALVTGFVKTCIVHTFDFFHSKIHKIGKKCHTILKFSEKQIQSRILI